MLLAYIYFAVSTTLIHLLNVNKLRYQRDNKLSMSDQYWDWHSLEFRHYCLLQQRRMDDAWKLDEHLESIVNGDDDLSDSFHVRQRLFFARYSREKNQRHEKLEGKNTRLTSLACRWIIETRQWQLDWDYTTPIKCEVCLDACRPCVMDLFDGQTEWVYQANAAAQLAAGLSAVHLNQPDIARECEKTIYRYSTETVTVPSLSATLNMMATELRGVRLYVAGRREEGLGAAHAAMLLEAEWNPPPYGPPYPMLPPSESYGYLLLEEGTSEAAKLAVNAFEFSLEGNRMRYWSEVGLKQAHASL